MRRLVSFFVTLVIVASGFAVSSAERAEAAEFTITFAAGAITDGTSLKQWSAYPSCTKPASTSMTFTWGQPIILPELPSGCAALSQQWWTPKDTYIYVESDNGPYGHRGKPGASWIPVRNDGGVMDLTIYMQYEYKPTYITWWNSTGQAYATSTSAAVGQTVTPPTPVYSNKAFAWWRNNNTATEKITAPFLQSSKSTTTMEAYCTYLLVFDDTGGVGGPADVSTDYSCLSDPNVNLPAEEPTKAGYTFAGWKERVSGSTYTKAVDGFISVYNFRYNWGLFLDAQWIPRKNSVVYKTGTTDAQVVAPQNGEFLSGAAFTPASAPIRAGYTFAGWSDRTGTLRSVTYTPEPPASGVLELTGQWTANKNTVKFDTLGGSAVADTTFETGGLFTVPQAPSRNGHRFTGWFDSAIGGNQVSGTFTPAATSGFTLFARWEKIVSLTPAVPQAILTLDVEAGARITGAAVTATASGLATNAEYTVELRSVPQIIARGYAVEGVVDVQTEIPAGLEPGWHTLTFRSISVDGTPITRVVYFEVSARGTLVSQSTVMPVELSRTGFAGAAYGVGGILLIIAGTVTTLFLRLISRRSQRP